MEGHPALQTGRDDALERVKPAEDETGIVETTLFPATYHRFFHMIDRQRPYLLSGKVEEDWGAITMMVDKVERIKR